MHHRTDKRDYLALMGYAYNIEIAFMEGINGSNMHPDAVPPVGSHRPRDWHTLTRDQYWKGNNAIGDHGCWRAHMDVYRQ